MRTLTFIATAGFIGLVACSSKIQISDISNTLEPGAAVNGIPFRVPKRFVAVILRETKGWL